MPPLATPIQCSISPAYHGGDHLAGLQNGMVLLLFGLLWASQAGSR